MALREQLLAVADELRRRKTAGEKTVSISEEALVALRAVVARQVQGPAPMSAPAAAPAAVIPFPTPTSPAAPRTAVAAPPVAARPAPAAPEARAQPAPQAPARGDSASAPSRPAEDHGAPAPSMFAEPSVKPALKMASGHSGAAIPPPPAFTLPAGDKTVRWAWLSDFVLNHPVCQAHVRPGKKCVLGSGSLDAKIFFCADAPGADEEAVGEPCQGDAGQLLTRMIKAMGVERAQVYIGSIMNWRPEMPTPAGVEQLGNRPPSAEELAFCLPFLRAQLEIVQPEVVVALGATAAAGLLGAGSFKTLGEVRGSWQTFAGRPVMVTYHPSYLLRNNSTRAKRTVWEDLLQVMERAQFPISDKQRNFFLER
jgi:DNA polymerase